MVLKAMTSLTIRDLRQRWPQAEKALETEEEILITRDGKPVAKLVRFTEEKEKRPRFDFEGFHRKYKKLQKAGKLLPDSSARISASRADRFERK
jgi:antitoxin (DNA-binding transcriptional repressor) of toxin-antitoxin stability system